MNKVEKVIKLYEKERGRLGEVYNQEEVTQIKEFSGGDKADPETLIQNALRYACGMLVQSVHDITGVYRRDYDEKIQEARNELSISSEEIRDIAENVKIISKDIENENQDAARALKAVYDFLRIRSAILNMTSEKMTKMIEEELLKKINVYNEIMERIEKEPKIKKQLRQT